MTIRELLTHTAGLTVHGFPGYAAGEPVPTLTQVLDGVLPANSPPIWVDATPGTLWRYSGGGYVILQQMLEDVTGMPFTTLMRQLVLDPIGMTHSTYEQPLPHGLRAQAATPYGADGRPIPGGAHTYPEQAPAGLWTTPSDLALYVIEVQKELAGTSDRVLSRATAAQMVKAGGLGGWGLGPQIDTEDAAHPAFTHSGADAGFISIFFAYDDGDGAVVMTNSDAGGQLMVEIMATLAREYGWTSFRPRVLPVTSVDPARIAGLVGAYQGPGVMLEIVQKRGRLVFQAQGQPASEFLPETPALWGAANGVQARFDLDAQDRATAVHLLRDGELVLSRVDPAEAEAAKRALEARVKLGQPSPGTEASLRKYIGSMQAGAPDYEDMVPELADAVRRNLPLLKAQFARYGALKAISFKKVAPGGMDVYDVDFERGRAEWMIAPLTPDGKVSARTFVDMPWPGKSTS